MSAAAVDHNIGVAFETLKAIEKRVTEDSTKRVSNPALAVFLPAVSVRVGHVVQLYVAQMKTGR
jgi:hypothetical protein